MAEELLDPGTVLEKKISDLLEQSPKPMKLTEIVKALGGKSVRAGAEACLATLVDRGILHVWPGNAYAREIFLDVMSNAVMAQLRKKSPQTHKELKDRLPAPARRVFAALLRPLLEGGQVFQHPKLRKRKVQLSLTPPDPLDYVEDGLKKLLGAQTKDFSEAALAGALVRYARRLDPAAGGAAGPGKRPEDVLLSKLQEVEPQAAEGALVFIKEWRAACAAVFPSKESFDGAVIALAEAGTIQLQSHDRPADLSDEERDFLIPNGRGSYFLAAGLRL
jgi:hypothetical protein